MASRGIGEARFRLDADSTTRLYRSHAEPLLIFFANRVFDAEDAVDLVADTFLAAFESRRKFRGATEAEAVGFIYGIARNKLLALQHDNAMRARKIRQVPIERRELADAEIERIDHLSELAPRRELVERQLRTLTPEHQTALELRVVQELDYQDVALRMKVTEQAARARVSRGLKALATRISRLERPT